MRHQHEVLDEGAMAHRATFVLNRAMARALDRGYGPWECNDAHPFAHETAVPPFVDQVA